MFIQLTFSATALLLVPHLALVTALLTTLHGSRGAAFASTPEFASLIFALASVTDAVDLRASAARAAKAGRLTHKMNVRVWRVLRRLKAYIPAIVTLLATKAPVPPRAAVLLGHVVGVALRAKVPKGQPEGRVQIEGEKVSRSSRIRSRSSRIRRIKG